MIILKCIFAVVLLGCCGLGPGLVAVRRLRGWWPLERLCAAVAVSLFAVYVAATVIFKAGLGTWAYHIVSAVCLLLLVVAARDLAALLGNVRLRRTLLWSILLGVWCLAALSLIHVYSGGGWGKDWLEHYQRSLFFLGRFPAGAKFMGLYELPARPPMMNLLGAFVMAQAGTDFEVYQVVYMVWNALVFLPCALLASNLARGGGRGVGLVAVLFALNPMFMHNVTYSWTKLLGGFYTVLAVWLYLRALRKGDSARLVAAVACLAVGVLVHYSVAVLAVAMAVHYLVFEFRKRRENWRELLLSAAAGLVILATWLGWSIQTYGWETTFASNTSVTSSAEFSAWGNVKKVGNNVLHTLLPHPILPGPNRQQFLKQQNRYGYWRDYAFLVYQTNVPAAMGILGGVVVLVLMGVRLWYPATDRRERRFWLVFVPLGFLGGVAAIGEIDYFGLAHVCLQPMALVGVTFLAVNLPRLPGPVRWLVAVGAAVDFAAGVLLQLHVENMTYRLVPLAGSDKWRLVVDDGKSLSRPALGNFLDKVQSGVTYWGDHFTAAAPWIKLAMVVAAAAMLAWLLTTSRRRSALAR